MIVWLVCFDLHLFALLTLLVALLLVYLPKFSWGVFLVLRRMRGLLGFVVGVTAGFWCAPLFVGCLLSLGATLPSVFALSLPSTIMCKAFKLICYCFLT